jgi:uncharacterized membrane protein YtjA (UPF0391 family)
VSKSVAAKAAEEDASAIKANVLFTVFIIIFLQF